jgi:single-strand DNA-binding protein
MLNTVILMGRMTSNPELRQTNSGNTTCGFSLAIDRQTSNGEHQTDFIRCVAWNKTAEWMSRYTEKGTMLIVEGSIRTGSYTDKKYPDVTHYTTEIWANRVSYGETKQAHELMKQNSANRAGGSYNGGNGGNGGGYGSNGYDNGGTGSSYGGGNNYGGNGGNGGNYANGNSGSYNNSGNNAPSGNVNRAAPAPFDNFPPQIGGLSDFEEVISDTDLPF